MNVNVLMKINIVMWQRFDPHTFKNTSDVLSRECISIKYLICNKDIIKSVN